MPLSAEALAGCCPYYPLEWSSGSGLLRNICFHLLFIWRNHPSAQLDQFTFLSDTSVAPGKCKTKLVALRPRLWLCRPASLLCHLSQIWQTLWNPFSSVAHPHLQTFARAVSPLATPTPLSKADLTALTSQHGAQALWPGVGPPS